MLVDTILPISGLDFYSEKYEEVYININIYLFIYIYIIFIYLNIYLNINLYLQCKPALKLLKLLISIEETAVNCFISI